MKVTVHINCLDLKKLWSSEEVRVIRSGDTGAIDVTDDVNKFDFRSGNMPHAGYYVRWSA